jgi:uncharacterized protein YukE
MKKTLMIAVVGVMVGGFASKAFSEKQPHMRQALTALENAQTSLKQASADKGGHRAKALEHIKSAIDEVQAGIDFDNKH